MLVVDDERDMREMLAFALEMDGFEIVTAASGREAVAISSKRKFAIVITDLKMPDMDGLATLDALKRIDQNVKVIVATGYASPETRSDCLRRGAFAYLCKPFDLDELGALLRRTQEEPEPPLAPAWGEQA